MEHYKSPKEHKLSNLKSRIYPIKSLSIFMGLKLLYVQTKAILVSIKF